MGTRRGLRALRWSRRKRRSRRRWGIHAPRFFRLTAGPCIGETRRKPCREWKRGETRQGLLGDLQVGEKLRCRVGPCDEKVVAGSCARDVEKVPLGVVDLLEVAILPG